METITWNIELIIRGILQAVLLLSSSVFSGSETALFSLSRTDLQQLRHRRDPQSESIHAMLDEPRRLIISILCGNELVNIASSANMAAILLMLFGQDAGWINILVMVPLLLLIGEVTPKTIAVNHPMGFSQNISARILPRWIYLVTPLREAVRLVADRVTTWLVGERVGRENILKRDELKTLLEEGEATGIIDASERVLIDNLLEASQTDISHVMTPGPRLCLLDADRPVADLIKTFREYRHPRVPVYRGHWDNVIGFIHSEDVLRLVRGGADLDELTVEEILRPAHFVPPTLRVDELFQFFQAQGTRAAIVLGEFGEIIGIVAMKDVLTFIFGELTRDISGSEEYERSEQGGHIVPGWMRLLDFYSLTNIDIDDPVMTTVGGLVFRLFGRLPKVGEAVDYEGYHFHVLGIDGLRISRLEVSKLAMPSPEPEPESDAEDARADATTLLSLPAPAGRDEPGGANEDQVADEAAKAKAKAKAKRKKWRKRQEKEKAEADGDAKQGADSGEKPDEAANEGADAEVVAYEAAMDNEAAVAKAVADADADAVADAAAAANATADADAAEVNDAPKTAAPDSTKDDHPEAR